MLKIPRRFWTSFDDFCFLTQDKKADLLDGVIWMAAPEMTHTNELWGRLMRWMYDYIEKSSLGDLYGSKVAFRFNEFNAPEPDLAFVAKERRRMRRPNHINGVPDLIAEIVVPDSIERDYDTKRRIYERHGVCEYWIVDEIDRKIVLLRLTGQGKYRKIRAKNGVLRSEVIRGFWLKPESLWQPPKRAMQAC